MIEADRRFSQQFSISEAAPVPAYKPLDFNLESLKDWSLRHRYQIVGYGWAAMAAGTLLYQWKRKDIRPSQKIINARLSSQVLALVGFGAIAGSFLKRDSCFHRTFGFNACGKTIGSTF